MEFKYVCRLCLSFSENFIGIFSEEGELLNVAHILATHFNIEVNIEQGKKNVPIVCMWRRLI